MSFGNRIFPGIHICKQCVGHYCTSEMFQEKRRKSKPAEVRACLVRFVLNTWIFNAAEISCSEFLGVCMVVQGRGVENKTEYSDLCPCVLQWVLGRKGTNNTRES